ncbi:hypothetical protein C2S53_011542 [Perilla frutescens var. hirtella]|uniref:J domain-containing protein n=1 Tax=Perilla frutescens var. hirtella TaxID=608512 RepID=A0AAD4J8U7_PERFH|nr:hypothetical protein C2S53_011542 [Perilla frutescens var. hirtella]
MDCNKEEAIRARDLAEMKMKNSDFDGARKIVLKAQNLYPELENISQLLSICDVHCSAQKSMLGSEKDWYGVLQVAKFADEMAIKKQYRRLALFLHPDKNRFPGAESAFKLICEANALLSDPKRKSLYDNKIRVMVRSAPVVPPPHHLNKTSQFNNQYGAGIKVPNGFHSMNQHQATRSSFSVRQEVFCTSCPFCCLKHQLDRKFLNASVRCQKCLKTFIGYEVSAQGVPLESKCGPESSQKVHVKPSMSQYSGFQGNGIPNQGRNKMGVQNGKGFSASHLGSQWCANRPTVPGVRMESIFKDKGVECAAKVSGGLKSKRKDSSTNSEYGGKEGGTCNGNRNNTGEGNWKNKRKGRRKVSDESSESYETSSDSDLEDVIVKDSGVATNLNSGPTRRSSRKRQNVSYNEGDDDDDDYDLPRSRKRSQGSNLSEDRVNKQNDALDGEPAKHEDENGLPADADCSKSEDKETQTVYPEERPQDKDFDHDKGVKAKGSGGRMSNIGVDEIETDLDKDALSGDDSDEGICQFEDPEFNDFDKDRNASCFAVNQYWSCYDSVDGMPRFYAKVKKVCLSPFEFCIAWLEADPADVVQKKWIDQDLPVGCGNFRVGKTQKMPNFGIFSQQVHCEKGKRGSLIIHPRRGEVWSLFKDWDLSWISQPESRGEYKYEVVEVLSDFDAVAGVRVCYLDKVLGFVSLFQRSSQSTTESFMIRPNELFRFSHCIRYYKMTGTERDGVPVGSLELDPAALPPNPDKLYYPGKSKMESDNMGHGVHCSPPKSDNFVKSEGSNPNEFVDLESSDL